jgi:hypothetical protein
MRRLRHPIHAIGEPFGKAGLAVAIIALVLAMGGGALAASGALSGKQRSEVVKIAKRYATAGAAGATGPAGPAGKNGARGAEGVSGEDGAGVRTGAASSGECPSGGIKVTSTSGSGKVCNGSTGFTETLPSGRTETGVFSTGLRKGEAEYNFFESLDFPIPLAAPIEAGHALFVTTTEQEAETAPAECPGSAAAPSAQPGSLCLYQGSTRVASEEIEEPPLSGQFVTVEGEFHFVTLVAPTEPPLAGGSSAGTSGAVVGFGYEAVAGSTWLQGSWAVTAP